jgi:hypothetical protein
MRAATCRALNLEGDAIDALRTQRDESQGASWRRDLGTKIAWTMVAKVLALTLLWLLFFRGHAA